MIAVEPTQRSRRRRRLGAAIVLSFAALIACDVALSLFAIRNGLFANHPVPPFGAITHPKQREWLAREHIELQLESTPGAPPPADTGPSCFDAELGWSNRRAYRSPDGQISVGALGTRGNRDYAPRPAAGVVRMLCFGDSFTWCDQVIDADAWPRLVEDRRADVEALNFGVSGYGTDQALLRFERNGRDLAPDAVVIGVMLENIGRNANRYRPLWYLTTNACASKPRFVLEGERLELVPQPFHTRAELIAAVEDGRVLGLLREHEHWVGPQLGLLAHSSLARMAAGWLAYRERSVERLWRDPGGEPYRVTIAILERFVREAREAGARRTAVLLFPREEDLRGLVEDGNRYWSGLSDELRRRGIDVIDASSFLAKATGKSDVRGLYVGGHLNRRGNEAVASAVVEWLGAK